MTGTPDPRIGATAHLRRLDSREEHKTLGKTCARSRHVGCSTSSRSKDANPNGKNQLTTSEDVTRRTIMSETLTMTRGQLHDLLARFAVENPTYREALIKDPKMVLQ